MDNFYDLAAFQRVKRKSREQLANQIFSDKIIEGSGDMKSQSMIGTVCKYIGNVGVFQRNPQQIRAIVSQRYFRERAII